MGKRRKRESEFRFSPEKFLDEATIGRNLILSSLYLFLFEVLKFAIIEDVKDLLASPLGEGRKEVTTGEMLLQEIERGQERAEAAYRKRLKEFDRNKWKASFLFLEEIDVIDKQDVDDLQAIEAHRNEIAHELPRLLTAEDSDVNLRYLARMREILGKIEAWQVSLEVAISPELEGKELRSSRMVVADQIVSMALSAILEDEKESTV